MAGARWGFALFDDRNQAILEKYLYEELWKAVVKEQRNVEEVEIDKVRVVESTEIATTVKRKQKTFESAFRRQESSNFREVSAPKKKNLAAECAYTKILPPLLENTIEVFFGTSTHSALRATGSVELVLSDPSA